MGFLPRSVGSLRNPIEPPQLSPGRITPTAVPLGSETGAASPWAGPAVPPNPQRGPAACMVIHTACMAVGAHTKPVG